jgi:hypothetical protein
MKRVLTIAFALLIAAVPAFAQQQYGWAISSSATDHTQNAGAVVPTPFTLFLHLVCADPDGMSAAEFDLAAPAGVLNFGFTPMNGFLNAGGAGNLLLAVGGCPHGPIAAGSWTLFGSTAGSVCLVNSAANGIRVTVNCDPLDPVAYPINAKGFDYGQLGLTCDDSVNGNLCPPIAVESSSWGTVKSLYR